MFWRATLAWPMVTLSSLRKKCKKIKKIWREDLISTIQYLETHSEKCPNFETFPVKSSTINYKGSDRWMVQCMPWWDSVREGMALVSPLSFHSFFNSLYWLHALEEGYRAMPPITGRVCTLIWYEAESFLIQLGHTTSASTLETRFSPRYEGMFIY